ncbi:MAG: PaaI family thioesterase [Rubrivivax sp.]
MGSPPEPPPEPPPPGFRRFPAEHGFVGVNGPLWMQREGTLFRLGFRVEARHCNPMGVCHGGMLATFADMLMPIGAISLVPEVQRRFLPTVSLQIDFIGPAKIGDWVEGEMQVLRTTRTLVFAQGLVRSNGVLSMRCSGVFRIGPEFNRPLPE